MTVLNGQGEDFTEGGRILGVAEKACIELLESVLADARKGNVTSVAVIACGPADFGAAIAGPDAAKLNLGLDYAKADIQAAIRGGVPMEGRPAPKGHGRLIRPGFRR